MNFFYLLKYLFIYYLLFSCNSLKNKDVDLNTNLIYDYHLYLNPIINDSLTSKIVFDSGANGFYLDSLFSSKMCGKAKISSFYVSGVGEKKQKISILNDSVEVDFNNEKRIFGNVPILNLKRIIGSDVNGLIGNSFFSNNVVMIDYKQQKIEVFKEKSQLELNSFFSFPIKKNLKKEMIVNLKLVIDDNDFEGEYLIDTGSPQLITFTNKFSLLKNLDTISNKKFYFSNNYGIGGRSEGYSFSKKMIILNDVKIYNPVFDFSVDNSGSLNSNDYEGIIGNRFLENFIVVIDYKNDVLYLKPNYLNNKLEDNYISRYIGFSAINYNYFGNGWLVSVLFDDGKNGGIEIGDIVLKVNDVNVKDVVLIRDFHKLFDKYSNQLEILRKNKIIRIIYKKAEY